MNQKGKDGSPDRSGPPNKIPPQKIQQKTKQEMPLGPPPTGIKGVSQPIIIEQKTRSEISLQTPIPIPPLLEAYRAIDPNLPERIIRWTEAEQQHRRELDIRQVGIVEADAQSARDVALINAQTSRNAPRYATFIVALFMLLCGYAVYQHESVTSAFLALGSISVIVGAIMTGRGKQPTRPSPSTQFEEAND